MRSGSYEKMTVRRAAAAVAGAVLVSGCKSSSVEAAPTAATTIVTFEQPVLTTTTETIYPNTNPIADPLEGLKYAATREMSVQGRVVANKILDYIADTAVSHAAQNSISSTQYDEQYMIGNNAYNLSVTDTSRYVVGASVGVPNRGIVQIGMDSLLAETDKSKHGGLILVDLLLSQQNINLLDAKTKHNRRLTLIDYREFLNDPSSGIETSVAGQTAAPIPLLYLRSSTEIADARTAQAVSEFAQKFEEDLGAAQTRLGLQ